MAMEDALVTDTPPMGRDDWRSVVSALAVHGDPERLDWSAVVHDVEYEEGTYVRWLDYVRWLEHVRGVEGK